MRSLKKILAVICVVAMLASIAIVPALAATSYDTQAATLNSLGLMTNAGLDQPSNRLQGLIFAIDAAGKQAEALAMSDADVAAALANVVDAKDIPAWGQKFAAYAVSKGYTTGVGGPALPQIKFAPLAKIHATEYLVWLLKIGMGYTNGTADILTTAVNNNIITISQASKFGSDTYTLVRDDIAGMLYTAVSTGKMPDGKKFIDVLVTSGAVTADAASAAGLYTITPVALDVSTIAYPNLREVVITFNKAPVADEAKKEANWKINGNNPEEATLSADGLTVTLRTSSANAMSNYSTNNKIEIAKAIGLAADKTISDQTVRDTAVPTINSVVATGPRTLKVTVSKPLKETYANTPAAIQAFSLDKGTVSIDITKISFSGNTFTLNTLSDLTDGNHSLELKNDANRFVDNGSFQLQPATLSFAYAKDTSAVTMTVDSSTETTVTVKFNKAMDWATLNTANLKIRHTYNTATNEVNGTNITKKDDQTFEINFGAGKPLPPGTVSLFFECTNDLKVKDQYGNVWTPGSYTVTTTPDTSKPTASVVFKDANTLEVTFSEKVLAGTGDNGAENKNNYTLKTGTDTVAVNSAAFKVAADANVVTLKTATMNGGSYTLTIKNVKDVSIAANKMDDASLAFTCDDKVAPTVSDVSSGAIGIQINQIGTKKIKVGFSEAMDPASITDKSNWMYGDAALKDKDTVEAAEGNKAAIITIDAGLTGAHLDLARVKDAAGNYMEAFSSQLNVLALAPIGLDSYDMTAKNTLKLKIKGETVSGAQTSDFQVSTNGGVAWGDDAIVGVSTTVDGSDTYITLTMATEIANTTGGNIRIRTSGGAITAYAKNLYDNNLQFTAAAAPGDKIAPEFVSSKTVDSDNDGKIDGIAVTYSEPMYAGSIQDTDYTVDGYEINNVSLDGTGTVVTVGVKEKDDPDGGVTPKVTQVAAVQDSAKNTLASFDAKTPTDKVGAAILSVTKNTTGDVLTIVLSETVTKSAIETVGNWTATGCAIAANGVSLDAYGKTVTVTLTGAIANGQQLMLNAACIDGSASQNAPVTTKDRITYVAADGTFTID